MPTAEVTTILQNISVIIASLVAIFGIDAWRREHVGRRRMDLAEEVLALFYQARDVIRAVRSPFGFSGEGSTRKSNPSESPEEKKALDNAYVVVERYNKHIELFSRIRALRYRFMAQVGLEKSKPFDELGGVIDEIFLAARKLSRYWILEERVFLSEGERDKHFQRVRDAEGVFWEGDKDPDPIQPRVDAAVGAMERTCQDILSSKGTLFGIINLPLVGKNRGQQGAPADGPRAARSARR